MSRALRLCSLIVVPLLLVAGCGSDSGDEVKTGKDSSGTSTLDSTRAARAAYETHKASQRPLLAPSDTTEPGATP